jgi:signal transduction histidine kinase
MNSTVTSSLEFVRPLTLDLAPGALVPLLDEAITVAEKRCGRPGIEIERRGHSAIPSFLMDRSLLRDVFVNLIVNAMEAVGDEGRVQVHAEVIEASRETSIPYRPSGAPGDPWQETEQFAVVRVVDSGPGIGDEECDRIFYPFFTTKNNGSGVGLAMAKKIVGSHRGMIDVDSTPGKGAAFSVRLPMVLRESED